jgi:hypothetical protein
MKKLVTTPLTNTIYWATVNEEKGTMNTSTRVDVTDNAIQAVTDHLIDLEGFRENGFSGYVYDKKSGGTFTLCLMDDDKYARIYKEDLEKLKEYKHMYEDLCK